MKKNTLLLIYLTISLLKFLLSLSIPYPVQLSDERQYVEMGKSFLEKGEFLFENQIWNHYPPLYPILISPTTLFDIEITFILVKLINSFISTSIIFPMYFFSREFFNKKQSVILSLISVFIAESFVYSYNILSENLYYPLSLFSIYFFYKSIKTSDKKLQILSGVFTGFSILSRSIGLILLPTFVLVLFIKFILEKRHNIFNYYKEYWIFFLLVTVMIVPWFIIRNVYYLGFSIYGITGYGEFSSGKTETFNLYNIPYYALINTSFLVIGSGFLFSIFTLFEFFSSKKNTELKIIFWSLFIVLISLCTFWSFTTGSTMIKIMGRYMETLFYPIIILGSLGIQHFSKNKDSKFLLLSCIICSFIVLFVPLDMRMATFNTPSTIFLLIPTNLKSLNFFKFTIPDIIIKIVLVSIPFLFYLLRKKLSADIIIKILLIFFIINFLVATIALRYASLDSGDFMEMTFWIKKNLPRGNILFDVELFEERDEVFWGVEGLKFWTDFNVTEGRYEENNIYRYVISKYDLPLNLIREFNTTEGLYDKQHLRLFLFENIID